jgi:hypothetical protein
MKIKHYFTSKLQIYFFNVCILSSFTGVGSGVGGFGVGAQGFENGTHGEQISILQHGIAPCVKSQKPYKLIHNARNPASVPTRKNPVRFPTQLVSPMTRMESPIKLN